MTVLRYKSEYWGNNPLLLGDSTPNEGENAPNLHGSARKTHCTTYPSSGFSSSQSYMTGWPIWQKIELKHENTP